MRAISLTNQYFPHFSPCETGGRKAREFLIRCRNCSQGLYSYFTFPPKCSQYKNDAIQLKNFLILKLPTFPVTYTVKEKGGNLKPEKFFNWAASFLYWLCFRKFKMCDLRLFLYYRYVGYEVQYIYCILLWFHRFSLYVAEKGIYDFIFYTTLQFWESY